MKSKLGLLALLAFVMGLMVGFGARFFETDSIRMTVACLGIGIEILAFLLGLVLRKTTIGRVVILATTCLFFVVVLNFALYRSKEAPNFDGLKHFQETTQTNHK